MKKEEHTNEVSEMETLFSNLSYEEFNWILKELRIYPTNFAKELHISPLTLAKYKMSSEMPLFIVHKLRELCNNTNYLKYLRSKYSKSKQK